MADNYAVGRGFGGGTGLGANGQGTEATDDTKNVGGSGAQSNNQTTGGNTDASKAALAQSGASSAINYATAASNLALAASSVNTTYDGTSGVRLTEFNYNSGQNDNAKRAYLQLKGNVSALKAAISECSGSQTESTALYQNLVNKYQAFILTNIQENLVERQAVLPTVGDSFATTFSGADPQTVMFSGYLPFDASGTSSWMVSFFNSYNVFLRASRLAKYRCYMKMVLPDFTEYNCYPVALQASIDAGNDTLVNFSMTAIVVTDLGSKVYGKVSAFETSTTKDDAQDALENGTTLTASTANSNAKDTSFWGKVNSSLNDVSNTMKSATNEVNKFMTSTGLDKVIGDGGIVSLYSMASNRSSVDYQNILKGFKI